MKYAGFLFFSLLLCACGTNSKQLTLPQTVFEISDSTETPTYQEIVSFWTAVAKASNSVQLHTLGETDSGEPLHVVVWSKDGSESLSTLSSTQKTVLLVNNGIHPGEPDGIDACMLWMKDCLSNPDKAPDNVAIAIIPVYNIGGAKNRNSGTRANQQGPLSYGFRGNAQNLDLNRDAVKQDSKNAALFAQLFAQIDPDLFIDTHVSNGADYQHVVTCLSTQEDKLGGKVQEVFQDKITPQLYKVMQSRGFPMVPYVNVWGRSPENGGIEQFYDSPRYVNGFSSLFHTPAYTVETHMLKPFKDRVVGTLRFLESAALILAESGTTLQQARNEQKQATAAAKSLPIGWKIDRSIPDSVMYQGYQAEMIPSKVTGELRMYYNHNKPFETNIPYYNKYTVSQVSAKPKAYVIEAGYWKVVERLQNCGVTVKTLNKDTVMDVMAWYIDSLQTVPNPYEGHYLHYNVATTERKIKKACKAGDYIIETGTAQDRILAETLHPRAVDSFFAWGFFDIILQQKEGFSPYVFEEEAAQMLEDNPELKQQFLAYQTENNPGAFEQLKWLYMRSQHAEEAFMRYPVYKVDW